MGRSKYKSILNPLKPYIRYSRNPRYTEEGPPAVEVDTSLAIRNAADRLGFAWVNTGTNTYATLDMTSHREHFIAFSTKQDTPVASGGIGYVLDMVAANNGNGNTSGIDWIGYQEKDESAQVKWRIDGAHILQKVVAPSDGAQHWFVFGARGSGTTWQLYAMLDGVEVGTVDLNVDPDFTSYFNFKAFQTVGDIMINTDIHGPAFFSGVCTEADAQTIMASGYGSIDHTCLLGWEVPSDVFSVDQAIPDNTELPDRADETKGWTNTRDSWMFSADARTKPSPYDQ